MTNYQYPYCLTLNPSPFGEGLCTLTPFSFWRRAGDEVLKLKLDIALYNKYKIFKS